jgi:hypothetical protein
VGTVQAQANMSLDGYVAKQDNTIGRLFDWLQNGEVAIPTPAGDFTSTSPRRVPSAGGGGCPRLGRWSVAGHCLTWPRAGKAGSRWTFPWSW